ncbi:hypothetical protein U9M48_041575 [Paspalum notatum var. saurae]|uniref:Uncharacterized protein n=1 Tax=Paspalum notatum var. saurae TaxID=547442 RepID=A0AAQ3UPC5_PASNO
MDMNRNVVRLQGQNCRLNMAAIITSSLRTKARMPTVSRAARGDGSAERPGERRAVPEPPPRHLPRRRLSAFKRHGVAVAHPCGSRAGISANSGGAERGPEHGGRQELERQRQPGAGVRGGHLHHHLGLDGVGDEVHQRWRRAMVAQLFQRATPP